MISAILLVAGMVTGCSISGAAGAAWGRALVMAVGVAWFMWEFHGGFRDREGRVAAPAAPSPNPS